jgi:hypothetical protein
VTNLTVRGCVLRAQVGCERGHPPGRGPLLLLLLHSCLWLCLGVADLQREGGREGESGMRGIGRPEEGVRCKRQVGVWFAVAGRCVHVSDRVRCACRMGRKAGGAVCDDDDDGDDEERSLVLGVRTNTMPICSLSLFFVWDSFLPIFLIP